MLVQSQCYCQFLVGSTGEPFKNRLLFHWLESQYRARTYVTEYVSCFVSLARQRQTQQTCSRCIAPLRSISTQHTKAPRERSKTIKSRQLSVAPEASHRTVRVAPIHPNKPKQTINNGGRCVLYWRSWLCESTTASKHGESNVSVFSCYFKYGGPKFLFVLLFTVTPPHPWTQAVLPSSPAMFWCYLRTALLVRSWCFGCRKTKKPVWN